MSPFLLSVVVLGCSKTASPGSLPVWTPADHDAVEAQSPAVQAAASPAAPAPELGPAIWNKQCTGCHGQSGRGDGPAGAATHPPDMSQLAWQKSKTDAELRLSIQNGKAAMPKFALPDDALAALVRHVRTLGQK